MKKILLLLMSLWIGTSAFASVVPEIEDYYNKKTTDFIQTRFPQRPFTVFIKVDTGETKNVKRGELPDKKTKNLPYLDVSEEGDFWSRTDLPLASFLPYLKTVVVKVEVDAQLTDAEFYKFKEDLFAYLKLSAATDKIEVTQMKWTAQNEFLPRQYLYALALGIPLLLMLVFMFITRMSVQSLVRGLSEPLKNISKSTEAFAGQSAIMSQGKKSFDSEMSRADFLGSDNEREKIADLLSKTKEHLSDANGKILSFFEKWGAKEPFAVGAILNEMNADVVKELFRWGTGDWWTAALTRPSQWNGTVLMILTEAHHEMRKQELLKQQWLMSADVKMLSMALSRLTAKEIGLVLKGKSLEAIEPLLDLLSHEVVINVCKYMYPGEWGKIIDKGKNGKKPLPEALVKEVYKKALEMKALRDEADVSLLFLEADLVKYLNAAVTKDEREVYRTLPESSRLVKNRFPFFKVFESSTEVLKKLTVDVSLEDWALALADCDREEFEKVIPYFTERQKFMVKSMATEYKAKPEAYERKLQAKRFIAEQTQNAIWMKEAIEAQPVGGTDNVAA